jgi:hypothetical protein
VTQLKDVVFESVEDPLVAIRAGDLGQPYLIIDALSLEPLEAIPPASKQPFRIEPVDPIVVRCENCVEAESLQGVSPDPNYGVVSGSGWASYEQDVYSGKRAALTRLPGAVMSGAIPNFRPGPYVATLSVFSYDASKKNSLTLSLGTESQTVSFGPGHDPGLFLVRRIVFRNVTSPNLTVTATGIEQPYLVIDTISLHPGAEN